MVSACLLGVPCNHRGGSSPSSAVQALDGAFRVLPLCPEVAGGLPTPRPAAERGRDGRVRTQSGEDLTDLYQRGARHALEVAQAVGAIGAVMKARSPSCGRGYVYDGSHSRRLVPGDGVAAEALIEAGFWVCSEEDLEVGVPSWMARALSSDG